MKQMRDNASGVRERIVTQKEKMEKMNGRRLREQIEVRWQEGRYNEIKSLLLQYKEITERDNDLATVCYLCTIFEQEKEAGQMTLFEKVSGMEELLERYTILKFYLRRIEYDVMDGQMEEFYHFLLQNQISQYELLRVLDFSVVKKDKVLRCIKAGEEKSGRAYSQKEGQERKKTEQGKPEKGICFILCTNNRLYAQECLYYIHHLKIPDGYWIDVLTVEEAESMTSGYQEAMEYSAAKYKIYLHQDTFIIYLDFLEVCLNLFRQNSQIGMIGNVGVRNMPKSGVMWDADRFGMLYEQHIYETELLINRIETKTQADYLAVEAVDGFLMVTQYDVTWRKDLFDKWDFYDCSQSMEFIRHGYQVVVPRMDSPWCVHDCGFINLSRYEEERQKFVKEYLEK